MEDSTHNPNAPGWQRPETPDEARRQKLNSNDQPNQPSAEWQQLREQIKSLTEKERSDFLIFLTGYFANPSSVFPETKEFWCRAAAALREFHDPKPVDVEEINRKLKERTDRFNQLIAGPPLSHPMFPFRMTRLSLALFAVAASSDGAWEVLEKHCEQRDRRDREDGRDAEAGNAPIC